MTLERVGILASLSNRTRLYLQHLAKHDMLPACAIYLQAPNTPTAEDRGKQSANDRPSSYVVDNWTYDIECDVPEWLVKHHIPTTRIIASDPNDDAVVKAVSSADVDVLIYAGPGGKILRPKILAAGKRFLHVHPGVVPAYRGSTTVYYTLLTEGKCGASAFFFDEEIDTGPVIATQTFPAPDDRTTIDFFYDPFIRAQLLANVLQSFVERGEFSTEEQDAREGETYFIIHPVLKHVAIQTQGD